MVKQKSRFLSLVLLQDFLSSRVADGEDLGRVPPLWHVCPHAWVQRSLWDTDGLWKSQLKGTRRARDRNFHLTPTRLTAICQIWACSPGSAQPGHRL